MGSARGVRATHVNSRGNGHGRRTLAWDDGAASERTVLSWQRTATSSIAVAALALRSGIVDGLLGLAIPIAVLMTLAGAAAWLFGRRVYRDHERPFARGAVLHERALLGVAGVMLIAAVGSAVLAVKA
jgi:uncharacterized membrane protein YidH (DUF202 family)